MTPKRIVIHHSYLPLADEWRGQHTVDAIRRYHIKVNGWRDIGYHWIIGTDGMILPGRPLSKGGAHCGTKRSVNRKLGRKANFQNPGSIGICCVGNYDIEIPSDKMISELCNFILQLQEEHHLDHKAVYGHRECTTPALSKTCPGKNLFVRIFGETNWENLGEGIG